MTVNLSYTYQSSLDNQKQTLFPIASFIATAGPLFFAERVFCPTTQSGFITKRSIRSSNKFNIFYSILFGEKIDLTSCGLKPHIPCSHLGRQIEGGFAVEDAKSSSWRAGAWVFFGAKYLKSKPELNKYYYLRQPTTIAGRVEPQLNTYFNRRGQNVTSPQGGVELESNPARLPVKKVFVQPEAMDNLSPAENRT
jgi:hypothetical protein